MVTSLKSQRIKWKLKFSRVVPARCGHKSKITDNLNISGKHVGMATLTVINGAVEYCHRCLEKMAIECAWCEGPIIIGEGVTLYSPTDKFYKIPNGAILHNENPLQLVGCLNHSCDPSVSLAENYWMPPGKVFHAEQALVV